MNLKNYFSKEKISKIILVVSLVFGCIFSITYMTKKTSNVESWTNTIEYLDKQKDAVLGLTVTSTTASTLISSIPDDAGTPLANKLADISSYFLVVLAAIYLEKYLLTILGTIVFKFIIPGACISGIISVLAHNLSFKNLAFKLFALGLSLFLVIPCSVKISMMIDETYQISSQLAIDNLEDVSQDTTVNTNENKTWLESIWDSAKDTVNNITTSLTTAYSYAKTLFNNLLEAFAIMIVTSCLIPIFVFVLFAWVIKLIFNLDFSINFPIKKTVNKEQ